MLLLTICQYILKLGKSQLSKIIQSVGLLGKKLCNLIGNLGKKALLVHDVPLAKDAFLN